MSALVDAAAVSGVFAGAAADVLPDDLKSVRFKVNTHTGTGIFHLNWAPTSSDAPSH